MTLVTPIDFQSVYGGTLKSRTLNQRKLVCSLDNASVFAQSNPVTAQEFDPRGFDIKPDLTTAWIVGTGADTIFQYSLPTPGLSSSLAYTGISFSVATETAGPFKVKWMNDGSSYWVLSGNTDRIWQYTPQSPWTLTPLAVVSPKKQFIVGAQASVPQALFIRPGGRNFYVGDNQTSARIYQYECVEPGNVATAVYTGRSLTTNMGGGALDCRGIWMDPSGYRIFHCDGGADAIFERRLTEPWMIDTAFSTTSYSVVGSTPLIQDVSFISACTYFYTIGISQDRLVQYEVQPVPLEIN